MGVEIMDYNANDVVSDEENCVICGNAIVFDSKKYHSLLNDLIEKNHDKCEICLEKIYTLKAYLDVKKHIPVKAGEYTKISQEFDDETINYYFSLLKKYHLIKSFNQDVFFLKEEDDFYESEDYKMYSKFLDETFKEDSPETDYFDDLDLFIDELESNNSQSTETTKDDSNEIITEMNVDDVISNEDVDNEALKNKAVEKISHNEEKKSVDPPTVKHINISSLVHKKEENKEIDTSKTSVVSPADISKDDNKTEFDLDKKEIQDKPLPQIKQIDISNLLKKDESELNNKKPVNLKEESEVVTIKEGFSEFEHADIVEDHESKLEDDLFKHINKETQDENPKIIENKSSDESCDNLSPDKKENIKFSDNKEPILKDSNSILKEESKIPPKKSNGQYSLHKGISYKIGVYKWTADIREKGKLKSLGLFDTEEEAYEARQEYIRKKNPNKKESVIPPKKSNNRFSLHDRVDYDVSRGKWFAYVNEYGVDKFLGYFNTEKEAYSKQCAYLNIYVPSKQDNGQYSLHNGVSFNKRYCKWTSTIRGRKRNKFLGYFCSELDALKAIELYEKSKGKILNIWTPPKEVVDESENIHSNSELIKTFTYESIGEEYMNIDLNGQIKDDKEFFDTLFKLNSFIIKINSLEVESMDDFVSLRASFRINSNVLNKLVLMLNDDGWIK